MTLNRRRLLTLAGASAAAPLASLIPGQNGRAVAGEVATNDDGLHVQPWFADTFLDLREDLTEAAAAGKRLAIFWEQRGCPYCREMHRVNLGNKEISDYIQKHFVVVQLNLRGAREVTDFDGKKMSESQIARRWLVNFTPTISLYPATLAQIGKNVGRKAESWRLVGYWKPFHFHSTFVYVKENANKTEPNFQRWLSAHAKKLRAQGKKVELW